MYFHGGYQGSRKCGSTGAALLGNGRPNRGNDANWEKQKKLKIRKDKRIKREMKKKEEGKKRGRGKEKERRQGLNILKNYRVTMKIRNSKAKNILRKMLKNHKKEEF